MVKGLDGKVNDQLAPSVNFVLEIKLEYPNGMQQTYKRFGFLMR